MTMTQTVNIPADHRLVIDVPREVPEGRAILAFTLTAAGRSPERRVDAAPLPGGNARTVEEALQLAEEKAADPNRRPLSHFFGILSPNTFGDGVAYQRAIRDEWDD